jgi:hypothetical protein
MAPSDNSENDGGLFTAEPTAQLEQLIGGTKTVRSAANAFPRKPIQGKYDE